MTKAACLRPHLPETDLVRAGLSPPKLQDLRRNFRCPESAPIRTPPLVSHRFRRFGTPEAGAVPTIVYRIQGPLGKSYNTVTSMI